MEDIKERVEYKHPEITKEDPRWVDGATEGEDFCFSTDGTGYGCTRTAGHEGCHAAHGLENARLFAVWPQEEREKLQP